jgi:hypothetical protein
LGGLEEIKNYTEKKARCKTATATISSFLSITYGVQILAVQL